MPPDMSSAPHTRPRISRKYLRNSRPRCTRVISACCSLMASMGFSAPPLAASLYHLVRPQEHRTRDLDADRLRGLEVEHQLELGRLLDRQIRRIRAAQDAIDVKREPVKK